MLAFVHNIDKGAAYYIAAYLDGDRFFPLNSLGDSTVD